MAVVIEVVMKIKDAGEKVEEVTVVVDEDIYEKVEEKADKDMEEEMHE